MTEASVSHLIIFNPDLKPSSRQEEEQRKTNTQEEHGATGDRDKDLEDDLKEASQIVFYTSRSGGRVSRDTMLRQFGLAKGLMGFSEMVLDNEGGKRGWWGVHSHKSRMIIYSPEDGFYIYLNVTLASRNTGESVHTSQGLSDHMLVDGLIRGYEDYRLLHGPMSSLRTPSSSATSAIDRFWTKFAFHFESLYLCPSDPGEILLTWLAGHTSPPTHLQPALTDQLSGLQKSIEGIEAEVGLIGRDGPLHLPPSSEITEPLIRFLVHQLKQSLPPPMTPSAPVAAAAHPERSTLGLGFGRRKKPSVDATTASARSSSWTSWMPSLTVGSSRPPQTTEAKVTESGSSGVNETTGARWPSLGLGGMGTMFGMGKEAAEVPSKSTTNDSIGSADLEALSASSASRDTPTDSHHVEQSAVKLPDLEAAVEPEDEIELSWEKKDVWLENRDVGNERPVSESYEKRRVSWIIRDETLLFVLYPQTAEPPYPLPPTSSTLTVFATLPTPKPRASIDSTPSRPSTPTSPASVIGNPYIYTTGTITTTHERLDSASAQTLTELKDNMASDKGIHELYAKTSLGKFVVAKNSAQGELYLQLGRKDASLTDAEQALRAVARIHPDLSLG